MRGRSVLIGELVGFPVPPSENGLYPSIFIGGKMRRFPSVGLKAFKKDVAIWAMKHNRGIRAARELIHDKLGNEWVDLAISIELLVYERRLFTQKQKRKAFDVSNRIKPVHDALAELLGIDDRRFCGGYVYATVIEEGQECATIRMETREIKKIYRREDGS